MFLLQTAGNRMPKCPIYIQFFAQFRLHTDLTRSDPLSLGAWMICRSLAKLLEVKYKRIKAVLSLLHTAALLSNSSNLLFFSQVGWVISHRWRCSGMLAKIRNSGRKTIYWSTSYSWALSSAWTDPSSFICAIWDLFIDFLGDRQCFCSLH